MEDVKSFFIMLAVIIGTLAIGTLLNWPDSWNEFIFRMLFSGGFILLSVFGSLPSKKNPQKKEPIIPSKFESLKAFLIWITVSLILGSILTLIWWPESFRELVYFFLFATAILLILFLPMLISLKKQPKGEQPLTPTKFKTIKQTLKWLINSVLLGALLAMFGRPSNLQEFLVYWMGGTVFFLGMLIGMPGAKEK
jgi:hypothetical protein